MIERLARERERLALAWKQYVASPGSVPVPETVLASWDRSRRTVPAESVSAPVEDPEEVRRAWRDSPLEYASRELLDEFARLADDGDLIAAIADPSGRLLWTKGSPRMEALARRINFVPGGRWDEDSVGTNALGLALRVRDAVRVFAAEHYVQAVHDWVCYSAPIREPGTGKLLGVLDFSTTWEYASPLGLASTKHYATVMEGALGRAASDTLHLRLCGPPLVELRGRALHLTPRQHELLAILALHPGGLTLDALHAHLYGDAPVSPSTLKSEVSTLRGLLGGGVASRPYRLVPDVTFDARAVEAAIVAGRVGEALDLYGGPLLPHSSSPFLTYWREYLDAAVREAVVRSGRVDDLWAHATRFDDDPEVLGALRRLLPARDPRGPVVAARLAALDLD